MKTPNAHRPAELARSASYFRHLLGGASRGLVCLMAGCALASAVAAQDATTDAAPSATPAAAQGVGEIRGRVFDAVTGRAVGKAVVKIEGTNRQTLTDDLGTYTFRNVPAGDVRVVASLSGRPDQFVWASVTPDGTAQADFTLGRANSDGDDEIFEMEELVIVATDTQTAAEYAIQHERYAETFRNVVDTGAYGIVPDGNLGEFVKFMPGVQVEYGGTYANGNDATRISVRGFNSDQTAVTIDGIPVASSVPGTLSAGTALDSLSINNAARVEVIKVPTPDQPNASIGGSVNLISKSAFEYPKPTLRFRVWANLNSERLDSIFEKTPGPTNESTYKTLPGAELTYAYPINDSMGLTLTLAHSNSFSVDYSAKTSYKFEGNNRVGPFTDANGTIGEIRKSGSQDDDDNDGIFDSNDPDDDGDGIPDAQDLDWGGDGSETVYSDVAHPFLDNVDITDTPRSSVRDSAALKFDWRPFDGHMITLNYQYARFDSEEASRRISMNTGANTNGLLSFGPDHQYSEIGGGSAGLDVEALDRSGDSNSAYIKWSFIKSGWDIRAHVSRSISNGHLDSDANGHFSNGEVRMGDIELTRFDNIVDGLPGNYVFYGLADGQTLPYGVNDPAREALTDQAVIDNLVAQGVLVELDPTKLSSYSLAGYDPTNPGSSSLVLKTGESISKKTIDTYKFDIRRELDFIPVDFVDIAVKAGYYRESNKDEKWGQGVGREYAYTGLVPITIEDYRDVDYVGVEPGYGFTAPEWIDLYRLYDFYQANPTAFSDTDDTRRINNSGGFDNSVAASNWISYVNQQKSLTETQEDTYFQIESKWFSNRLSVIGGARMTKMTRKGRVPYSNGSWRALVLDQDENGDGLRDPITLTTLAGSEFLVRDFSSPILNFPQFKDPLGGSAAVTGKIALQRLGAVYNTSMNQEAVVYDPASPMVTNTLLAAQTQRWANAPVNGSSETDPAPLISSAFELTDKITLRAAWSKTNSQPRIEGAYGILNTYTISDTATGVSGTINLANPDIEPEISTNWDFSASYYTDTGGKITVSYYIKDVANNVVTQIYDFGSLTSAAEAQALAESFDIAYEDRYYEDEWVIKRGINVSDSVERTVGYELEIQQNLGIFGDWGRNYQFFFTVSDSDTTPPPPTVLNDGSTTQASSILSTTSSKLAFNSGITANIGRFSAQVSAAWRDEVVERIGETWLYTTPWVRDKNEEDGLDRSQKTYIEYYEPAKLTVDLTLSYRLTDHYTLNVSGRNITNAESESYIRGEYLPDYAHTVERSQYGVMWTIGLTGQY